MLLYSWNVNGIRAAAKKGFLTWLDQTQPDIIGLQETKAHEDQLTPEILLPKGYKSYWHSGERRGYSGVCLYTKQEPISITTTFPLEILTAEGRIIQAEFDNFILFNVYFPNGKRDQIRLDYKMDFYDSFLNYILKITHKPIIICGDVNTAHTEIDLARPKENKNISGFLQIERDWITKLLNNNFLDTFRLFTKAPNHYTWWDQKTGARARNIGWRIDYFLTSKSLEPNITKAEIHPQILGSDHCPISLTLNL